MTISVTLADANILISRTLRDYFLYAAKLGALDIHWSETILDETIRNLVKQFEFTRADAKILVERLEAFLPSALVEVEKRDETRAAKVKMDDKDRHVLAAALSANADLLLTQNVRHFPRDWMAERGIELIDAGTLLTRLATDYPDILRDAHRLGVSSRPQTSEQVLAVLERDSNKNVAAIVRAVVEPEAQSETGRLNRGGRALRRESLSTLERVASYASSTYSGRSRRRLSGEETHPLSHLLRGTTSQPKLQARTAAGARACEGSGRSRAPEDVVSRHDI